MQLELNYDIPTWSYVIEDMKERNYRGAEKYNRFLNADCPDNMLQHLYEELLDAAVYVKTLINKQKLDMLGQIHYNIPLEETND
jgi:hypothetical protein